MRRGGQGFVLARLFHAVDTPPAVDAVTSRILPSNEVPPPDELPDSVCATKRESVTINNTTFMIGIN